MTQTLRAALRAMLGPDVGIGITDPRAPSQPLWPDERPAMARAIPKRLAEFTAGRQAARAAMADLGLPPAAIPMGDDRAPIWPAGLAGSIAHTDDICIAVISQSHESIGVDVEPATPLDRDLWDTVCTAEELGWLQTQPDPGLAAKMIFCSKEAVYKAQYPLTGRVIGFEDVQTKLIQKQGLFRVNWPIGTGITTPVSGRISQDGLTILASALPT